MYFTLAISAAAPQTAALAELARRTDPQIMPLPGPADVAWRSPDGQAAVLTWGSRPAGGARAVSHAGTIRTEPPGTVSARTGPARVDPVYLAQVPGAVVVSDRACWAAAVTGRLTDPDPAELAALLCLGYPAGSATPFRGVEALAADRLLRATGGQAVVTRAPAAAVLAASGGTGPERVAAALVEAVRPLASAPALAELSLTGGRDSRLIAAALVAARVPFRARTHGTAGHPDVAGAAAVARRLGVEHVVIEPATPGTAPSGPGAGSGHGGLVARVRSAVLTGDGMLSAFENLGARADPPDGPGTAVAVQVGGHGGELLRGGYAETAWAWRRAERSGLPAPARRAAAAAELFRRLTLRRLGLLRPGPAAAYLASLAPDAAALTRRPLAALDDFYLANRAGRWSAAARQAYLLRGPLVQPFFDDGVVRAVRAVPLRERMDGRLHRETLAVLCPAPRADLLSVPLAGKAPAAADWRRGQGSGLAGGLREYVLETGATGPLFDIVRRPAAERVLDPAAPGDPHAAWALATMAALLSGDWLNARQPAAPAAWSQPRP